MSTKERVKERVIEELKTIIDPEIGIDIYSLGLIYQIEINSEKQIKLTMTYTTPFCPYGQALKTEVENALRDLGFSQVRLAVTFEPPWKPPENLREMMGI